MPRPRVPARPSPSASKALPSSPGALTGSTPSAAPSKLLPVLATLVDGPPPSPEEWLYEIKFDGYRMLTRIDAAGDIRFFTRNGNDWTSKLKHLEAQVRAIEPAPGWLDGEIVMLNDSGTPDFQALQNAFDRSVTKSIVYFLFDVPHWDGYDLRLTPLSERRELLERILTARETELRFSSAFDGRAEDIVASACRMGLEGIIGKRRDSIYSSKRSAAWIKLKCTQRQEFVIGGYTDPKGSRSGLGAILVGVYGPGGALQYAGSVGSGFSGKKLSAVVAMLEPLAIDKSPFAGVTDSDRRAHWVKPVLVAEVSFAEWTKDGHLRHSVFHALRSDKDPKSIIREKPMHLRSDAGPGPKSRPAAALSPKSSQDPLTVSPLSKLKVSNPERVVDETTGLTKLDLVRHYALVGPVMMEHLKGRPVSLVRAPEGIAGELFFQKHLDKGSMPGILPLDPALHPGHQPLLTVATPQGLLSAAQMNVIEFHTWNGMKTGFAKPDRMTFDLDPGEGVEWKTIQQAAELVRVMLSHLELGACAAEGVTSARRLDRFGACP